MRKLRIVFSACVIALSAGVSHADQAVDDFFYRFMEASHDETGEKHWGVVHDASLKCLDEGGRKFFSDVWSTNKDKNTVPVDATYTLKEMSAEQSKGFVSQMESMGVVVAEPPQAVYKIVYTSNPARLSCFSDGAVDVAMDVYVSKSRGQWKEVIGCPSEEIVADFNKRNLGKQKVARTATALVSGMDDEIRGRMVGLLSENKGNEAVRFYRDEAGVSRKVSREVVEMMCENIRVGMVAAKK